MRPTDIVGRMADRRPFDITQDPSELEGLPLSRAERLAKIRDDYFVEVEAGRGEGHDDVESPAPHTDLP